MIIFETKKCEVCDTDNAIQRHHITPVSQGGRSSEGINCCVDCGNQVHMLFTNKELAKFGNLETLLRQEEMAAYVEWKKKHPGGHRFKSSVKVKQWKRYHRS